MPGSPPPLLPRSWSLVSEVLGVPPPPPGKGDSSPRHWLARAAHALGAGTGTGSPGGPGGPGGLGSPWVWLRGRGWNAYSSAAVLVLSALLLLSLTTEVQVREVPPIADPQCLCKCPESGLEGDKLSLQALGLRNQKANLEIVRLRKKLREAELALAAMGFRKRYSSSSSSSSSSEQAEGFQKLRQGSPRLSSTSGGNFENSGSSQDGDNIETSSGTSASRSFDSSNKDSSSDSNMSNDSDSPGSFPRKGSGNPESSKGSSVSEVGSDTGTSNSGKSTNQGNRATHRSPGKIPDSKSNTTDAGSASNSSNGGSKDDSTGSQKEGAPERDVNTRSDEQGSASSEQQGAGKEADKAQGGNKIDQTDAGASSSSKNSDSSEGGDKPGSAGKGNDSDNDDKFKDSDKQPKQSDSQRQDSDSQPKDSDSQPKDSDSQPKDSDSQPKDSDSQPKDSDIQSKDNDSQPKDSDSQPKESDSQKNDSDSQNKESDSQNNDSDSQSKDSDSQNKDSDRQPKESENQTKISDNHNKDSDSQNQDIENQNKISDNQNKDSDSQNKDSDSQNKDSDSQTPDSDSQPKDNGSQPKDIDTRTEGNGDGKGSADQNKASSHSTAAQVSKEQEAGASEAPKRPESPLQKALKQITHLQDWPQAAPLMDLSGFQPGRGASGTPPGAGAGLAGGFYALESGPDRCAGIQHKRYAFKCAAAEAQAMGRVLAVHKTSCISGDHTQLKQNLWAPAASYFDFKMLEEQLGVPVVYLEDLVSHMQRAEDDAWQKYVQAHNGTGGDFSSGGGERARPWEFRVDVFPLEPPTLELEALNGTSDLVVRQLRYWQNGFEVCNNEKNKKLWPTSPEYIPFNRQLIDVAKRVVEALGGRENFTAVHIRRGDKARRGNKWPHLNNDTSPERLKERLPSMVPVGSKLYIATDEESPSFFDPLKELYRVYRLQDFGEAWGQGTPWHKEFQQLLGTEEPKMDVYMTGIIDDYIVWAAHKKFETFNDLTEDPRNGV